MQSFKPLNMPTNPFQIFEGWGRGRVEHSTKFKASEDFLDKKYESRMIQAWRTATFSVKPSTASSFTSAIGSSYAKKDVGNINIRKNVFHESKCKLKRYGLF